MSRVRTGRTFQTARTNSSNRAAQAIPTAVAMNPLWEKLRDEREPGPPVQQKHSGRKRSSKHKNQMGR